MKKIVFLIVVIMAMCFLAAQDRYETDLSYFDDSGAHTTYYTQIPSATITEIGVRFTALYPISQLQSLQFYIYEIVGQPTGATINIHNADANGMPTGIALGSFNVAYGDLIVGDFNTLDVSSLNLSFAQGTEFIMTLSVNEGAVNTDYLQTPLNRISSNEFPSHSVYLINGVWNSYQGVTIDGEANSGGEYFMSATVDYNAPFRDVSASSIWFTGDLLLPLNSIIEYEADVENTGDQDEVNIPVSIEIRDATYPSRSVLYSDTQILPLILTGTTVHIDTYLPYQYTAAGEYVVTLRTGLAGDIDTTNNEITLEQQVVVLPTSLSYDDGTADSAWTPSVAGNYFLNEFECPIGPVLITDLHYYIWDRGWPDPGTSVMGISVFVDDGFDAEGNPGAPGTEVYYSEVDCARGAWNSYNIADHLVIARSGKFFVGFKTLDSYPYCPALAADNSGPHSAWKVSWESSGGLWYQVFPEYEMDWMIRASVAYVEFWPPEDVTITQSGNDILLDWMDVPDASYYHVYYGTTPTTIATQIGGDIGTSSYAHIGGATLSKTFYKVNAAIETGEQSKAVDTVLKRTAGKKLTPSKVPPEAGVWGYQD